MLSPSAQAKRIAALYAAIGRLEDQALNLATEITINNAQTSDEFFAVRGAAEKLGMARQDFRNLGVIK
jgi:hypothetical protein